MNLQGTKKLLLMVSHDLWAGNWKISLHGKWPPREHCVSPARVAVKETNIAWKPCERRFFLWWEPVSFYRRNPHNPECLGQGCLSSFLLCWPIQLTETRGVSYLMNLSVTTDRRQFTLFYLLYFSLFFCILFACLRFGSHFRSHDTHVTGEHMVELGGHFCCCFSARANSSSTYTYTYTVYLK